VVAIDELCERLYDLAADLPAEGAYFVPEGGTNSIAMLVLHMAWGEASWVARITRTSIPPQYEEALRPGAQGPSGDLEAEKRPISELIALTRDMRAQYTRPALAALAEIDSTIVTESRPMTARGVLMHLIWHWTYHSGQVGLVRRLWGSRYQWRFDPQIGVAGTSAETEGSAEG
jgi:uncharacterized damage-inducible protein DinB